jgi:hypothetical protein
MMVVMAATGLALLGCTEGQGGGQGWKGWQGWKGGDTAAPTGGDKTIAAGEESYTILLCAPYMGFDHVRDSAEGKRWTEEATKWKGVYVVHEERSSSLYMGRYADEGGAVADLAKIRVWKSTDGGQPFALAMVTKLAGERVGRPEWDLSGAKDPNWVYTVVIAEFYNVPKEGYTSRKQLAAANCEDLRSKGVEAFYFHGPAKSFLTIGVFPIDAFKTDFVPMGPDKTSSRMRFASEALKKVMHDYPYLAVNGRQAKLKGTDSYEGTYVQAISEYSVGKITPAPPKSRYLHPSPGGS